MNAPLEAKVLLLAVGLFANGCSAVVGGNANLPHADKNGTHQTFVVNEAVVIEAVTNAFADHRYRGMMLYNAVGQDYLLSGWHPTNGFTLEPTLSADGSITNVSVGRIIKRTLPYVAYFHVFTTPIATNQTEVTVRTIVAKVRDGKEPGIHMTWANHYRKVPPVRQEEQNVLSEISTELTKLNRASTNHIDN